MIPMARQLIIRPWTPEDDAKLLELLGRETPVWAIARRLRRSIGAVRYRAKLLALRADGAPERAGSYRTNPG